MAGRIVAAGSQSQYRLGALPKEVAEIIIRHVGVHLNRLAQTNLQLHQWSKPFLDNALTLSPSIVNFRFSARTATARASKASLSMALAGMPEKLSGLTYQHSAQYLITLGCKLASKQPAGWKADLAKVFETALALPPEQTAYVLAVVGKRVSPVESLTNTALARLAERSPRHAQQVQWVRRANALPIDTSFSAWKTLLNEMIAARELPYWLPVEVMELATVYAWHQDLKLEWVRLALSTSEPLAACLNFIDTLACTRRTATKLRMLAGVPKAEHHMCVSLATLCSEERDRAEVIAALCLKIVHQLSPGMQANTLGFLYAEALKLPAQFQSTPLGALIKSLSGPEVLAAFLLEHSVGAVLDLITRLCSLQTVEAESFTLASCMATQLPAPHSQIGLQKLSNFAAILAPSVQSAIFSNLSAHLLANREAMVHSFAVLEFLAPWMSTAEKTYSGVQTHASHMTTALLMLGSGQERQRGIKLITATLSLTSFSIVRSKLIELHGSGPYGYGRPMDQRSLQLKDRMGLQWLQDVLRATAEFQSEVTSRSSNHADSLSNLDAMWKLLIQMLSECDGEVRAPVLNELLAIAGASPEPLFTILAGVSIDATYANHTQEHESVLALILSRTPSVQRDLLIHMAREILARSKDPFASSFLERILKAAAAIGIRPLAFLHALLSADGEAQRHQYRNLTAHPILLDYVKRNSAHADADAARLLMKMISSWHAGWNRTGFSAGEEYDELMMTALKFDEATKAELLMALAPKIKHVEVQHQSWLAEKLFCFAEEVSAECKLFVEKELNAELM